MRKLMLLYLFGVLMLSCTKEGGNISVEGRVYNPITGEGIKNIGVKIIGPAIIGGAPGAQSSSSPTISSTLSDDSGYFNLSGVTFGAGASVVFTEGSLDLHVIGIGDNNVTGVPTYNFSLGLNPGKHNKVDFWVVPYGNLKLDILNVNCEGEDDKLFYKRFWVTYNQETNGVTRFGCFQFNGNYFQLPIGEYRYEWEVTRNSVTTYHDTTFNILENGFHTVTIHY